MTDVEEIISYIKLLKRGFDKDLFQSKIDELSHVVDTSGLDYEDFHKLFKVWLNLSIPLTKWTGLGSCLVPKDIVEERTVDYAVRWLLGNCYNYSNLSRMAFLLDWLTAAMDSGTIDMEALDASYEVFYNMLSFEVLTSHTVKLVYTLTKPSDVTRRRVLELLGHAKQREGKKDLLRQLQVLLGLFKSYKPECVPEDVPAISIHTAFKKINAALLARFKRSQDQRNSTNVQKRHLMWFNLDQLECGRNKKADPLLPNLEFLSVGSDQYSSNNKSFLDFSDPTSLLAHYSRLDVRRPMRARALLSADAGLALLAAAPEPEQDFLQHDLYHLLCSCFLQTSPYGPGERAMVLRAVSRLQRVGGPLPLVTRFLAQYLPLWNERDHLHEILSLAECVDASSPDHVSAICSALAAAGRRADPLIHAAITRSLANMYTNMVFSSMRSKHNFLGSRQSSKSFELLLPLVASHINDSISKDLQAEPDDMRVLFTSGQCLLRMARADCRGPAAAAPPGLLALALPLLSPSALLLENIAKLMLLYKKIFKSVNKSQKGEEYMARRQILEAYTRDLINFLYEEQSLSDYKSGFVLNEMHPQLVSRLRDLVPEADTKLGLRKSLAFVPHNQVNMDAVDPAYVTKKMYFDILVAQIYPNLSEFLRRTVPELR